MQNHIWIRGTEVNGKTNPIKAKGKKCANCVPPSLMLLGATSHYLFFTPCFYYTLRHFKRTSNSRQHLQSLKSLIEIKISPCTTM